MTFAQFCSLAPTDADSSREKIDFVFYSKFALFSLMCKRIDIDEFFEILMLLKDRYDLHNLSHKN